MTLISYAQNFEDVVLFRALHAVKNGFYVDVGAWDPDTHSVTKLFYESGWSGINIEPSESSYQRLVDKRPRDVNLRAVAGSNKDKLTVFEVEGASGLTTVSSALAHKYRAAGQEVREFEVPVVDLTSVLHRYSPKDVHFLKIDVEGAEAEVIASLDLELIRPWIIVVEAVEPFNVLEPRGDVELTYFDRARRADHIWRESLLASGYVEMLFDGLNVFFVAKEHHADLGDALRIPANVLDDVQRIDEHLAAAKSLVALAEHKELSRYLDQIDQLIKKMHTLFAQTIDLYGRALTAKDALGPLLAETERTSDYQRG